MSSITDLQSALDVLVSKCTECGIEVIETKDIPYGKQITVSDEGTTAQINIYFGKQGFKALVQGKGGYAKIKAEKIVESILSNAPNSEKTNTPKKKSESMEVPLMFQEPWIGSDESGKGDFFGGLVTAGVIVDPEAVPLLQSLGVDDSKKINDSKIQSMATEIRKICYGKYKVLSLVPAKYNDLYERMKGEGKNLNSLLAWAHVSVLENLLEIQHVKLAIADKFADEKYINSRLKKLGRTIELIQVPKAEQNIAVAAASILARDAFLRWHQDAKKQHGITFPKGANAKVVQVGRSFVQANGEQALRNVAKLHFKTTDEVLR